MSNTYTDGYYVLLIMDGREVDRWYCYTHVAAKAKLAQIQHTINLCPWPTQDEARIVSRANYEELLTTTFAS